MLLVHPRFKTKDDDVSEHTPPSQPMEEEGEVSDQESVSPEQEELPQELDQEISEEQTYRETIRSFTGWKKVPVFDSMSSSLDDNPFAGTRTQLTGKVSVKVLVEWLCRKMEKLNVAVQEGYPSYSSETASLVKDHFVKIPKTLKWYDMFSEKKDFSHSKVHGWTNEPTSWPVLFLASSLGHCEEMGEGCMGPDLHV